MLHTKPKPPSISPPPFKPSHLSIPAFPFTPRTPLLPSLHPQHQHRSRTLPTPDTRYVPPSPLQWLWQCHQCRRTYSLGVTRRCLEDGHAFCAGTTTVKTWRRPLRPVRAKRGKACASEFDYAGWKAWGRWKRSGKGDEIFGEEEEVGLSEGSSSEESSSESDTSSSESDESMVDGMSGKEATALPPPPPPPPPKDCWNMCDYPSECRWGKRFGVHTPVDQGVVTLPPIESFQAPVVTSEVQLQLQLPSPSSSPPMTFEGILKPENCSQMRGEKKGEKTDFWGALVASATRRKSVPPSSPLASGTSRENVESGEGDKDGDVAMGNGDLDLAALQAGSTAKVGAAPSLTRSASVVSLKDIIRKGAKRSKSSVRLPGIKEKMSAELYEQALEELAPLERVKSRDSGYHSTAEGWEIGKAI